jgi:hypothetical protein
MARVFVAHERALGRRVCEGESELLHHPLVHQPGDGA